MLTIVDNDVAGTLQFSPAALSVSEAAGPAVLTVTRNQKSTGVTVHWAVVAEGTTAVLNTDYGGPTSGQSDFGEIQPDHHDSAAQPAGVPGLADLRVQLSNPSNGATLGTQKTATLTITDDEIGLKFSQPTYTASEGSTSITIPVVRTGRGGAVSVAFTAGPPGTAWRQRHRRRPTAVTPGPTTCP